MKKTISITTVLLAGIILIASCSKGPGEGGKAAIQGKIKAHNYDATFTQLLATYYVGEQDVYLVYGDDPTYSGRVKTNYDGTYVFPYLRPGKYKVYAYTKDTVKYLNGIPNYSGSVMNSKYFATPVEVEIGGKKDSVTVPDIDIIK